MLCIASLFTISPAYGQQLKVEDPLPDSVRLSLEYVSFLKVFSRFEQGGEDISKKQFRALIKEDKLAHSMYTEGRRKRIAAGALGFLSTAGLIYFTREWIDGDVLENPPPGYFASYFGIMGAAILGLNGKNKIQLAMDSYNNTPNFTRSPISISLHTGRPTYGIVAKVDADDKLSNQRSFGVGVAAHLYKEYFGFVDYYSQAAVTDFGDVTSGSMQWDEEGYTVMTGIGANYVLTEKINLTAKYGIGINSINRVTTFRGRLFSTDTDERSTASQLGLGLNYSPIHHFSLGISANLSSHTPLLAGNLTYSF